MMPQLSKPKILELARCEWITQKSNCCLVGSHGTGKRTSRWDGAWQRVVLVLSALLHGGRAGHNRLEKEQKHTLDRFLTQPDGA